MIAKGEKRPDIINFIFEESARLGYQNTITQCSNIYNENKSRLKAEFENNQQFIQSDLYYKMMYLYKKSLERNNFKEARQCLDSIAKLSGLYNGNQVAINNGEQEIKITFD